MIKPAFCICKNKGADQLRGNRAADQHPLFSLHRKNNFSTIYIRSFKPLAILCGCTARFVSDLVGNPKTCFLMMRTHIHHHYGDCYGYKQQMSHVMS